MYDAILNTLDDCAARMSLPVFTDEQDVTLDSRMHGYRGEGRRWALLFELLVYWPESDGFQGLLAAYGTDWPEGSRIVHRWQPLAPSMPELDDAMEPVGPDLFRIGETDVAVDWVACRTRASAESTAPELEAFGGICEAHRGALWLDAARRDALVRDAARILTLDEWRHPDLWVGEKPSERAGWRSLAAAITRGGEVEIDPESNNRDWRLWYRRTIG